MKRFFTSLTLLTLLLLFGGGHARAKVTICGNEFSSAVTLKKADYSFITNSGTITYDGNKTLTLSNVNISVPTGKDGISVPSGLDEFVIVFEGSCYITSPSTSTSGFGPIFSSSPLKLQSKNSLTPAYVTLQAEGSGHAIWCGQYSTKLTILPMHLTAKSNGGTAIFATNTSCVFSFGATWIDATGGTNYYAISGFKGGMWNADGGINLACLFDLDYNMSTSAGGVVDKNGALVNSCSIVPALIVGGVPVSGWSTYTVNSSASSAVSAGTATWNRSAKTLTLSGFNLSSTDSSIRGIENNGIPGLNIKVSSASTITTVSQPIKVCTSTTITGTGPTGALLTLKCTSSGAALQVKPQFTTSAVKMTFDNIYAKIEGGYGIEGWGGYSSRICNMVCNNAFLNVKGASYGSITDFNDMTFTKCAIANPTGAHYNASTKKVVKGTETTAYSDWVDIHNVTTEYNLYVAGERLNDVNKSNFYSKYLTSGTVTFDGSSKLKLNNVKIEGQTATTTSEGCAIHNSISGLEIELAGSNTLTTAYTCMQLGGSTTFTGGGNITAESTGYSAINIGSSSANVTMKCSGGTQYFKGATYGFNGMTGAKLTIEKNGSSGGDYFFDGTDGHIMNTQLTLGTGVYIWGNYTWFNDDEHDLYYKNDVAKHSNLSVSSKGANIDASSTTVKEYDVYVAGTQVNSLNAYGLWNKYVKGGQITFDTTTKTLSLNGAVIDLGSPAANMAAISFGSESAHTLELTGTNTLKGSPSSYWALMSNSNLTVQGSGSIDIPDDFLRVNGSGKTLTIKNATVKTKRLIGVNDAGALTLDGAKLELSGTSSSSSTIEGFSSLSVSNTDFAVPQLYSYTSNKLTYDGSNWNGKVIVQPLTHYEVYVAGVEVNSYNYENIFADPVYKSTWGTSGTAKFNASQRKLQLSGVNITAPSSTDVVKINNASGATIECSGTNTLNASGSGDAIFVPTAAGPVTLSGTSGAKLTASNTSSNHPALLVGSDFTVTGLDLNANGMMGYNSNRLTINDATVSLTGFAGGTLTKFTDIYLGEGLIFSEPSGARYDSNDKQLEFNTNKITGAVKIEQGEYYPIRLAGVKVNNSNCNNITGTGITGGTAKYDPSTKTLTLNNVTLNYATNDYPLYSLSSQLTVVVEGNCTLKGDFGYGSAVFGGEGTTIIKGPGTLTADGGFACYGDLVFENAHIKGTRNIIYADALSNNRSLTIKNSEIEINPTGTNGAIFNFASVNFEQSAITSPAGAEYVSSDGLLYVGSSKYTGAVKIEPVTLYGVTVAGVPIHSKNAANVTAAVGATSGTMTITKSGSNTTINLNNFKLSVPSSSTDPIIWINDDAGDVTINLSGTNELLSDGECVGISFNGAAAHNHLITGSGKLISSAHYGIAGNISVANNLTIKDTHIEACMLYNFDNLTIDNSYVALAGDNYWGTIEDVNTLTLTGSDFTTPNYAYFDTANRCVVDPYGDRITGAITIEAMTKYDIAIAGIEVTSKNADNVTGLFIKSGKVSYDATNRIIKLENVLIENGRIDIKQNSPFTKIELVGKNIIKNNGAGLVANFDDVSIFSNDPTASIEFLSTTTDGDAIVNVGGNLEIHKAMVKAEAARFALMTTSLTMTDGANLYLKGGEAASENVMLNISAPLVPAYPAGLTYSTAEHKFLVGGADAKEIVIGEDYGFTIGGIGVNSATLAFGLLNVDYNNAGKVLTLDNEAIGQINNPSVDNLTLSVMGANSIEGIITSRPMTIDGTGTLAISRADGAAINATADVRIKGGVSVELNGINAYDGNGTSTLHVEDCVVSASGIDEVFKGLAGLDLISSNPNYGISEPANAVFDGGTVKVAGEVVSGQTVLIGEIKSMGISVAGVDITTVNAGGVEGTGINSGTVTYDEGTKTLTLNNVDIEGQIATDIINIRLIGDNKVHMADGKAFYTKEGGFRFYSDGTGTLDVTAAGLNSSAIEAKKAITFENCLVVADGGQRGLSGVTQDCVVTVDNAAVRIRGEQSCVAGMKNIVLANGVQANPTASNKEIRVNPFGTKIEYSASGDVVRNEWIDLSEPFNIWLGQDMLTRATVYKTEATLASGVTYNRVNRVLSLNNAELAGIWNGSGEAMTVIVEGTCSITGSKHGSGTKQPALYVGADVNLQANTEGSVITLDGGSFSAGVYGEGIATLSIGNHLTVLAKGKNGITSDDKQLTVNIDKSTFMAEVTAQCITGLKALNMTDCGIVTPQGAAFNAASGAVELSGSAVTQSLVIDPSGAFDAINGIAADDADIDAIYAVDGKKLSTTQTGVNIVRRNDGTVTKVLRK